MRFVEIFVFFSLKQPPKIKFRESEVMFFFFSTNLSISISRSIHVCLNFLLYTHTHTHSTHKQANICVGEHSKSFAPTKRVISSRHRAALLLTLNANDCNYTASTK